MEATEQTNLTFARILNLAMQNGVSHWSLTFEKLQLGQEFETYFWPSINWLEAEGLIRVESYARTMGGLANGAAMNVSLTSRGMAMLGQKIKVGENETTVAEQVKGKAEGSISTSGVGDFIGAMLGGFTKSMGS